MRYILFLFLLLVPIAWSADTKKAEKRSSEIKKLGAEIKRLKGQVQTIYEIGSGRPAQQGIFQKGLHSAQDQITLVAGRAIVEVNTSIQEGKQDLSFVDKDSYRGWAWTTDSTDTNRYTVIPLSGTKFLIRSSDPADASTINYMVTGD